MEGITGIFQGLSWGVKERLWIVSGLVQDHMKVLGSPWVMPEWPTVSKIQLPFALTLHLCEEDLVDVPK